VATAGSADVPASAPVAEAQPAAPAAPGPVQDASPGRVGEIHLVAAAPTQVGTPAVEPAAPVVDPLHDEGPVPTQVVPASAEAANQEFWPAEPPKKRGALRRIPISAVLEVLAVLLILVFIILRLS
jgi:hypothetical protein